MTKKNSKKINNKNNIKTNNKKKKLINTRSVTTGLGQLLQAAVSIACLIRQLHDTPMSSWINLAPGLALVAEISDSNDGQDASGLAPDAINFVKNQTYDYSFVSSAGLAPAVLTFCKHDGE